MHCILLQRVKIARSRLDKTSHHDRRHVTRISTYAYSGLATNLRLAPQVTLAACFTPDLPGGDEGCGVNIKRANVAAVHMVPEREALVKRLTTEELGS